MTPQSSTLAFLILTLAAPTALLDRPTLRHAEGQDLARSFRVTTNWALEEMTQTVAGSVQPQEPVTIDASSTRTLNVTDRVQSVANGRAVKFARTFDEIAGSSSFDLDAQVIQESYAYDVASDLGSRTVVFEQSDDGGAWGVAWDENSSGEDALLEGLDHDLDLAAFLPPQDAEPGATWKLPAAALWPLLAPAGELAHLPVDAPEGPYQAVNGEDVVSGGLVALTAMRGEIEGEVRVTWPEDQEPGVTTFELAFEAELSKDLSSLLAQAIEASGAPRSGREDLELEVLWGLEGTGTLTWDIEAGRWASYSLSTQDQIAITMAWQQDAGGQILPIEIDARLSGSSSIEAAVE